MAGTRPAGLSARAGHDLEHPHAEQARVGAQDVSGHRQQGPDRGQRRVKRRGHHRGAGRPANVGLGPHRDEEDRGSDELAHAE